MKPATLFQFLKQKICFFVQRQEMNRWLSENREKYDKVMFQETRAFPCREIHCAHLSSILVHIDFMLLQTFVSVQLILWSTTHSLKGINALGCSHISQAQILIVMTMKLHSGYSPIQKWQKWQRLSKCEFLSDPTPIVALPPSPCHSLLWDLTCWIG